MSLINKIPKYIQVSAEMLALLVIQLKFIPMKKDFTYGLYIYKIKKKSPNLVI